MVMQKVKLVFIFFCVIVTLQNVYGGNPSLIEKCDSTCNLSFSFNADLVSRYIWRGLPLDLSANIQPYASLSYKDLSFGAWGSYSLANPYAEMDLYLSYSLGMFSFTLNDYFNEDETNLAANDYLNWSNTDTTSTPHALEGCLTFNGTESFPLSFTAATYFYGNDKDTTNKNYYSTYLELGYSFYINDTELKLFMGGTPAKGYYASKTAIVNVGLTGKHEIKITESFSIPASLSLIVNPNAKDVFLVFGMTF
jgi:hypothetical protein